MAFGFPAAYSQLTPLNNLPQKAFILNAITICKKLNWKIINIDENELIAISQNNKNTWYETISFSFDENTAIISSSSNGNQIYDRGRNKKNTEAFLDLYFEGAKNSSDFEIDEAVFFEQIKKENVLNKEKAAPQNITSFYSFFSIFTPSKGYWVTPILIYINLLVFLAMTFSGVHFFKPEFQNIIDWGGLYGSMIYEGEFWRLLTSCFVHFGFFHLILSCLALAYVGLLLEPYLKIWTFLATYFFCSIITSLSSLYWNKDLINAGASGAIFGLYGILLVTFLFKTFETKINLKLLIIIIVLISLNILYGLKYEIGTSTHIAGFTSGILFGFILSLIRKRKDYSMALISSLATVIIACLFINFKNSKVYIYQVMEYEKRMQEFTDMEKMALEAYSTPYGNSIEENKESVLYMIRDRGIYYWNENISLINELDKLYLPKEIHEQNEKLIEYCKLRISLYELACKKIVENTAQYNDQMLTLNFKIESILNQIKKAQSKS
ncbi:rhomboid family intramembrane serine protease [Flavobacterium sp. LC2016-01]|uniref:rhomboid family intramembrane serine protease n=1 Tax=Flavobacterium sp. LC2016-01 TaxID=2675876 RepID=UPI0012BACE89|nr:rhomboid family intramembrane serine protease [Flavobacterium sp. LC2016-01]MTH14215.1 rhomboid family intramembrane serine protease [Flavobacterium sp. LC2016-01]